MMSTRPNDLLSRLYAVAKSAARLCNADDAVILRAEDDYLCVAGHYGSLSTVCVGQPFPIRDDWLSGRAFSARAGLKAADMTIQPCADFDSSTSSNSHGYRSALSIPLISDGQALGVISILRREALPFTSEEEELLQYIAESLVDKIELQRVLREIDAKDNALTVALGEKAATSEVLHVISKSTADSHEAFTTILENATRLCNAQLGQLYVYDGETFTAVAMRGASPAAAEHFKQLSNLPSGSGLGRLVAEKRSIHIPDIADDDAYRTGNPLRVATVNLLNARTFLAIPLLKDDAL